MLLADRHNALEADRAVLEPLLVRHPSAVSGEADDVLKSCGRHLRRGVLEEGGDPVVVLQPIQARRDPAGNAADHRAHHVVFLQGLEVLHFEQLDRREAERLALAAEIVEADFGVAPFADRVAHPAFELNVGGRQAFGQRGGGRGKECRAARDAAQCGTTGHRCRHGYRLLFGHHTRLAQGFRVYVGDKEKL